MAVMIKINYSSLLVFFSIVLVAGKGNENEIDGYLPADKHNVCICSENGADYLSVKCSGFNGTIQQSDIENCRSSLHSKTINPELFKEIHIIDNKLNHFDLRILSNFTNVKILNISRNNIHNITWKKCSPNNLTVLDLSFNNIENITSNIFTCIPELEVLDMKGNPWNCLVLEWFLDWVRERERIGLTVSDKESIQCFKYYAYNKTIVSNESMWKLIDSCPEKCSCKFMYMNSVTVDCSGRNLTDFPRVVPKDTRSLNMTNNRVKSFHRLINESSYWSLSMLFLTNNQIESLTECDHLQRYVSLTTLHLDGNCIRQIQPNILQKDKLTGLKLGRNPWDCDCHSGTALRKFIDKYINVIHDLDNISCSSTDAKLANKLLKTLNDIDLCYVEKSEPHFLDVISALTALLIIIIVTKIIYDFIHFKRTGKLPLGPKDAFLEWKKNFMEKKYKKSVDSERESFTCNSNA